MNTRYPLVAKALDRLKAPTPFFFRDDDAGWADAELFALCDRFTGRAPLDIAVIPAELSGSLASDLLSHPSQAGLHQHGYAHRNHQTTGRKCELADDRPVHEIAAEISAGRELLADFFGDRLDSIFTPPWNRCGAGAAHAVAALGIRVLSRDRSAVPFEIPGLFELPVTVDWVRYRDDLDRVLAAATDAPPVGVMLHHEVMAPHELDAVEALLDLLVQHPNAELWQMRDLLPVEVAGR